MIGIGFVRTIAAFSLASMIITPGARAAPDVPATGTTLPLKSGEYVLKFADGKCGALSMTPQNEPISARTWIGGCRYGLAEGPGLLRQKDGSYIRATARHGIIDTNTGDFAASYHTFPDQIPQQFILYASAIGLEAPSFDPDFVFSAQQSSDQVSTSIKLQAIKRPCPGWTEAREFVPVKVTINGTTGSTGPSDVRNIVAQCGPVPGKSAPYSVRMAIMEGNRHLSLIWSSETEVAGLVCTGIDNG